MSQPNVNANRLAIAGNCRQFNAIIRQDRSMVSPGRIHANGNGLNAPE
jgi:hypothetical protein